MIPEKVRRFCADHNILHSGSRVLCACSGGADSTALLHMLCTMDGVSVVCAHYNHCLRGAESDRDEAFVKELCRSLSVPFVCERGDVAACAAAQGIGTETAARTLRYAFLERAAEENGCAFIATAHNARDNAETILMNLIRGSGLRGLCGIPPVRGKLIRPLLTLDRAEIEAYLAENGLDHVEDSTNADEDYCLRNRIRHRVLPLLLAENPAALENMSAASELLRADEEYLSALAESFMMGQTDDGVSVTGLLALPEPVQTRVALRLCETPSRHAAEAVLALCRSASPHGAADLPGVRVEREYDRLIFGAAETPKRLKRRELRPGETLLPEAGLRLRCTETVYQKEIHKSFNTFYFKNAKICDKLYITSRLEGDSVRLQGRNCMKSLKKLFSEAHIPLERRGVTPVLRDGAGVAAVYGFGAAERLAPEEGDAVLCVEITEIEKM